MQDTEKGIKLIVRKKGAAPNAVRPAYTAVTISPRSGARRAAGVTATLAKRSYRPDLRAVSPQCPCYSSPFHFPFGSCVLHLTLLSVFLLDMHHLEPAGPP